MGNFIPELPGDQASNETSSDESESDSTSDDDTIKRKPTLKPVPPMRTFADIGVKVTFHKLDAQNMHNCSIQRCSPEDRNDLVEEILASQEDQFASDIFQFGTPAFDWREKALVSVVTCKKVSKRYQVTAMLKMDGNWSSTEVKMQNDCAEFITKLRNVKYFVIMSVLKKKIFKIPRRGTNIRVDETSNLELSIPEGAVDSDQEITIQVLQPDPKIRKKYPEGKKQADDSIVGLTDCLYTNGINFKKPVTVKLPFEKTPAQTDGTTLVAFQVDKQMEAHMMEPSTEVTVDSRGVATLEVQQFRGCCAAVVKTDLLDNKPLLERKLEITLGTRNLATILVFKERHKSETGYPKLWIELVDTASIEEVVELRTQDSLMEVVNSRSQDISIFNGFRLRIDLAGGLQFVRDIPKNFYLLTYLDIATDHHKCFPVVKGPSGTSLGTFTFLSDKWNKRRVHEIDLENSDKNFEKALRKDGLTLGPKVRRASRGSD